MVEDTDVTLADIARYADIFYIGGTKMGALCGEAVVLTKNNEPEYFINMIKQHVALMAKEGYKLYIDSPTNQQFFIIDNDDVKVLERKFKFAKWARYDDNHTISCFITSWATTEENINQLLALI